MNTKPESKNIGHYMTYLAITQVDERMEAAGLSDYRIATGWNTVPEEYWRGREEEQLEAGEMPSLWEFGTVQVYPEFPEVPEEEARELEQGIADELMRRYADIRYGKDKHSARTFLHWKRGPVSVTVNLGTI